MIAPGPERIVGRKSRIRGMIGGQARIVGVLSGIPVPQIGVFTGWALF